MYNTKVFQKKFLNYKLFENKKKIIDSIIKNRSLKSSLRWFVNIKFSKKKRKTAIVRIKNRCLYTVRSKSFYRVVKASRMFLKFSGASGINPENVGIRPSSW